jgi:hypothetical protein
MLALFGRPRRAWGAARTHAKVRAKRAQSALVQSLHISPRAKNRGDPHERDSPPRHPSGAWGLIGFIAERTG